MGYNQISGRLIRNAISKDGNVGNQSYPGIKSDLSFNLRDDRKSNFYTMCSTRDTTNIGFIL